MPCLLDGGAYHPLPVPRAPGEAIKARRLRLGLSQAGLARLAGVDEGSVRRLEVDTKQMARRGRQAVHRILGFER